MVSLITWLQNDIRKKSQEFTFQLCFPEVMCQPFSIADIQSPEHFRNLIHWQEVTLDFSMMLILQKGEPFFFSMIASNMDMFSPKQWFPSFWTGSKEIQHSLDSKNSLSFSPLESAWLRESTCWEAQVLGSCSLCNNSVRQFYYY